MEVVTADEREKRQAYLKWCWARMTLDQSSGVTALMSVKFLGMTEARAEWSCGWVHFKHVVITYDNLLDYAAPQLVRLRCEHLCVATPSDIDNVVDIITGHMFAVGEFAKRLIERHLARVEAYVCWYLNQKHECTYSVLVETAACQAVARMADTRAFVRFEFK